MAQVQKAIPVKPLKDKVLIRAQKKVFSSGIVMADKTGQDKNYWNYYVEAIGPATIKEDIFFNVGDKVVLSLSAAMTKYPDCEDSEKGYCVIPAVDIWAVY